MKKERRYNRGSAYAAIGKTIAAIQDLTKAVELDQNYGSAYHNKELLFYRLGILLTK